VGLRAGSDVVLEEKHLPVTELILFCRTARNVVTISTELFLLPCDDCCALELASECSVQGQFILLLRGSSDSAEYHCTPLWVIPGRMLMLQCHGIGHRLTF
jgi:hypothetical protein